MFVAGLFVLIALPAVLFMLLVLPMFEAGDETATGLVTGEAIGAGLVAGLFALALLADSPQAMPRAPRPRTVESRITFFIVFYKLLFFLKE